MGFFDTTLIITKQIAIMFLMVGLGYALIKTGFLTESFNLMLSKLLLHVIMPCLLLSSFQIGYDPATARHIGLVLLLSVLVQGISIAVGRLMFGRQDDMKSRVAKIGVGYCNCGFMGLPLLHAILGAEGVIYASVFIIVFNIATWTHSYAVLRGGRIFGKGGRPLHQILLVPNILAAAAGLALYFMPFRLPSLILTPLESIGAANTPLAMLVLGGFLAKIDFRRAFTDKTALRAYFGRLVLCPAVSAAALVLLPVGEAARTAMFVISAMPASTSLGLMAGLYDADGPFGAQIVAVSTLLSAVTIPLMTGAYFALGAVI